MNWTKMQELIKILEEGHRNYLKEIDDNELYKQVMEEEGVRILEF